ncbi:hypothetical protein MCOR25_003354 [Pyricularia grisea]|nr:hypothetical protein MCOR25_003354 [Pyricularia grisea]
METADILEEIDMLQRVVKQQSEVIDSVRQVLAKLHPKAHGKALPKHRNMSYNTVKIGHINGNFMFSTHDRNTVHMASETQIEEEAGKIIQKAIRQLGTIMSELEKLKEEAQKTHTLL